MHSRRSRAGRRLRSATARQWHGCPSSPMRRTSRTRCGTFLRCGACASSMAAGGNLFIAGHSLGGALAAITAHRLVTELDAPVTAIYTFGMPRPGSPAFAAAYDQRLGMCTYRLVQGEDIVPTVAPSFLGFRHLGRYLHCDRGAKFD